MTEESGSPSDVHAAEIQGIKDYAIRHGKVLGVAVCVALLAVTAIKFTLYRSRSRREEASRLLAQANSPADLQDLLRQYRSTPSAPLALLKLAKASYDMEDYQGALNQYDEFIEKHPEHSLMPGARLGKVCCTEAMGRVQEALDGFRSFTAGHKDHFLVPQAVFGEARCLAQQGRTNEAVSIYEDFIAANPRSRWVNHAEEEITRLKESSDLPAKAPSAALPETAIAPVEVLPGEPSP